MPTHPKPPEWVCWRQIVRTLYSLLPLQLHDIFMHLDSLALVHEHAAAAVRHQSWKAWCRDSSSAPGAARIHKFIKGPTPWATFELRASDGYAGTPQVNADVRAQKWHKLWEVSETPPVLDWPPEVDEPPPVDLDDALELRSLCLRCKRNTAIGCDWVHPRHFGLLSLGTIRALLTMARALFCCGFTPSHIALLLIALIPA